LIGCSPVEGSTSMSANNKLPINPKFVQELLGHADISLTLNTYSHVLPDIGDAAATAMDAALG
jgi:integrase